MSDAPKPCPTRQPLDPAVKAFADECRKQDNGFSSNTMTTLIVVETSLLRAFLAATED